MFASDDMVISTGYLQVRLCQMRLAAQVSLMFITFARYEESAAVRMGDMHRDGDNLIVMFPKGKTYQFSESRMADITGNATLMINPVQVIRVCMSRLEGVSGNKSRLLFPNLTLSSKGDLSLDKPASYDSVLNQFKSLVREAGLSTNPADFGLHLMRRGGVTAAVNGGADEHFLVKQMRVASSSTVRRYATVDSKNLASVLMLMSYSQLKYTFNSTIACCIRIFLNSTIVDTTINLNR